eukprot:jgi/Phyca11/556274/estExt2_Genewise1Plus.C_PHYCAscaffold_860001
MDLLMDIASIRKRLRKLRLAIDSHTHSLSSELEALVEQSPATALQRKCAGFFPTLLQALDARGTSGLSELQGLGYFPMDQPTFLALQTFVNGFHTEWKLSDRCDKADRSALFFKGNLLWSSMETTTLQLLYKFLRLREERGMTVIRGDEEETPHADVASTSTDESELWMRDGYEDTFLPVWSSKTSYTECDVVSRTEDGPPHSRKVARSLHKQRPASLTSFTSKNALKSRARSISFRNAGFLLKNGCFLKLLYANRGNLSESAWDPHRVVVWHEEELTMLILFRLDGTELDSLSTDATQRSLKAATFERLEDYLENQQRFQSLAQLILKRYNTFFAPEKNAPNLHPLPPFLYINRINLAFRMQHVPRLLKSKEDDLFPVPVKLLPHYFPASTLALFNELHAELHKSSSTGNREIYVHTRHAGWMLAKKSETSHRELYILFDSKISSFLLAILDSLQILLHNQFGNVLF